jgi:quercetin dioxygenase-like cupin family protein
MIGTLDPFVEDESKKSYKCGPVYFYEAKAGSVLADHSHEMAETLWIIEGSGEITIDEETEIFEAPCVIKIKASVYHKFMPKTDVKFIEHRHKVE